MEKLAINYFGMNVYEIPESVSMMDKHEQFIFPKRKNKRIQARFRNNKKYWRFVKARYAYTTNNRIYADKLTIEELSKAVSTLTTLNNK